MTPDLRLTLPQGSPERYRVRVFFRTWQVASRGFFWSVFWLFWANVLRRLARWQGPLPDPQGPGLLGSRAELVTWGGDVETGPGAADFCFPQLGEKDRFPALASLLGTEPPSPGGWGRGGTRVLPLWTEPGGWQLGGCGGVFSPETAQEEGGCPRGPS